MHTHQSEAVKDTGSSSGAEAMRRVTLDERVNVTCKSWRRDKFSDTYHGQALCTRGEQPYKLRTLTTKPEVVMRSALFLPMQTVMALCNFRNEMPLVLDDFDLHEPVGVTGSAQWLIEPGFIKLRLCPSGQTRMVT